MKLFFDMEFTGLRKDTSVISLGIIDENGRSIYAEYIDYNKEQVDSWIKKNVIDNTMFLKDNDEDLVGAFKTNNKGKETLIIGDIIRNRKDILEWISLYKNEDIQFVSDVCHYDMVLLIDILFDHAMKMPKNICAACHDINQDIARYKKISIKEAFDFSREDLLTSKELEKIDGEKHNSLYDAKVIRAIYNKLNK